ncbi:MAG: bifunctional fucokinase/L-fucose-1-P-guanylyltransferase [Oscillospiraceae bacterium]|nr:bifunctional fucokinase/L-fucose-1-P-guanylyltransferase [Oscillospiraceae bacterium]
MNRYTTLFEQQSYQDALDFYLETLENPKLTTWDYVILTASNQAQAKAYEMQIEHRLKLGQLPAKTHYAVIPDLDGKRVGSGGATFSCIKYVAEREGLDAENPFSGKKVLVIHSGGDSKRVPQYSACGKLFSSVPRLLPDGRRSTLFDEFMIGLSTVAGRISDGMLICSGDVLLLFNALQIDFYGAGAAALSIKEDVETGKNHGVYLKDSNGNVGRFLHKQTVETLSNVGAVDSNSKVDIDTGAVVLTSEVLNDLYKLIDTDETYHKFVNEKARLSFYADFLYPLASGSTLEQFYKEKPEGDFTPELHECRTALWETLSGYNMKLIRLSPASFIHFGTTRELRHLMTDGMDEYRFLDWSSTINSNLSPRDFAVSNSYVSRRATVGTGSYIEDSRIHRYSKVGEKCVISGVTLTGETVPDGSVLHGLKLDDGRFVCRMYGVDDNPKENTLFGNAIGEPLWTAPIYPVCNTIEEAVKATLELNLQNGWKPGNSPDAEYISLRDSFNRADVTAILPWQENLYEQVVAEAILENIDNGVSADEVKKNYPNIDKHTVKYLLDKANRLDNSDPGQFSKLIRIYAYLWKLTGENEYADKCFGSISDTVLATAVKDTSYRSTARIARDEVKTSLPVRVNWGGGWSDTPPYCMEHGGTVLNAAISLSGELPIEVTLKRLDEHKIVLCSTDIGAYKEFTGDLSELQSCRNPQDAFALHKAALIASGLIPYQEAGTVEEICESLGSGLYFNTRVINIPKGSGLGTSSILAGACIKGLYELTDTEISADEMYQRVLCMEQLMSTGGGWQDQVGGLAPGIKMVSSRPGLKQEIVCTPLNISKETLSELNSRFALIYTGQRRLARNLLRDVVGRYVTNDRTSLEAHYNIQRLAVLMRFELEKGNVDGFAKLLSEHWEESKRLDSGSTNTCIDQIFASIDDLIDGRMICGAGGGGFIQVVLKKNVSKSDLSARLGAVFQDSGVAVYDCEILPR